MSKLKLIFSVLVLNFAPVLLQAVTFKNILVQLDLSFTPSNKTVNTNRLKDALPANIYSVDITNQNIPVLTEYSVADIRCPAGLHLRNNGIVEIQDYAFSKSFASTLDLSYNKIEKIAKTILNDMKVSEIDLSHNRLKTWSDPWCTANCHKFRSINLEHNLIESIHRNALKNFISDTFFTKTIYLANNKISTISKGFASNLDISYIDLSRNKLKRIPGNAFDNCTIEKINLDNNQITNWNVEWFNNCTVLGEISIRNNTLEDIPHRAFQNLKTKANSRLKLILSYNQIMYIPEDAFQDVEGLDELWLDHNWLDWLQNATLKNTTINILNLEYNRFPNFQSVEGSIVGKKFTYLDNNKFGCDQIEQIVLWANEQKPRREIDIFVSRLECKQWKLNKRYGEKEKKYCILNPSS